MIKLIMNRFGEKIESNFESLQEAAETACMDVETNEAAPYEIWQDGKKIWENDGPFSGCYDELRKMAKGAI